MKIKTLDITAKEWFDRANGNSYFSAQITINYGMKTEKTVYLPIQYGYSSYYMEAAAKELAELKHITMAENTPLWKHCQGKKIILRDSKYCNCLKRDVTAHGQI